MGEGIGERVECLRSQIGKGFGMRVKRWSKHQECERCGKKNYAVVSDIWGEGKERRINKWEICECYKANGTTLELIKVPEGNVLVFDEMSL
jgi:ribosomal protein L37E